MTFLRCPRAVLVGTLLALTQEAFAICLPVPHYRYVGNDAKCTDADIQSAIDNPTNCPGTTVVITSELTYAAQQLTIAGKAISLAGSGGACGSPITTCDPTVGCGGGSGAPPAPPVTITGTVGHAVIAISGSSSVTLQGLRITGSSEVGPTSGGVFFNGTGSLTITASTIDHNQGFAGGGISFNSTGGAATLNLGIGTIIEENTAIADGGGIYLGGSTRLLALAPYTFIGYNHAPTGNGGGIAMEGVPPIVADIGSPGYNGTPVIQFNDAAKGGGIAIIAPGTVAPGTAYDLEANLFTTDPNHPGAIFSNTATQAGGGIYLKSNYDSTAQLPVYSGFCATSFNIDGNVAPEGSAIYSDLYEIAGTVFFSGGVSLNPSYGCYDADNGTSLASLGAATCSGVSCNTLNGNGSLDAGNQPTAGAVIYADRGTFLDAERFVMRFNQGGNAIHLVGSEPANIFSCLLVDNSETAELIRTENGADTDIDSCTVASNTLGGASVIYNAGSMDFNNILQNSIIDQPGLVTLNAGSPIGTLFLLSNDLSTLPFGDNILGAPTYVNAAAGDYHLQLNSLGIDYAPAVSYPATPALDFDGKPRVFDIPAVKNVWGPRDLGAYERSPACYRADTVHCDGFEGIF